MLFLWFVCFLLVSTDDDVIPPTPIKETPSQKKRRTWSELSADIASTDEKIAKIMASGRPQRYLSNPFVRV